MLRKRRGYPGWRMMGTFGRSAGRGEGGPSGARDVIAGSGVQETEMAARSSREELERITAAAVTTSQTTTSSGKGDSAPLVVGGIDDVVAGGDRRPQKQAGGGAGGPVRYS